MPDQSNSMRTNIGDGRRQIKKVTDGKGIDFGLADQQIVTSHLDTGKERTLYEVNAYGEKIVRPHAMSGVPPIVESAAVQEFLAGSDQAVDIEKKYHLSDGYLGIALRRRFPDSESLQKALSGSLMTNALVFAEHARLNVDEMTPAQAALASKISVDAALGLEKHRRDAPRTINFGALAELGEGIARLSAFVMSSGGVAGDGTDQAVGGFHSGLALDEDGEVSQF